MTTHTPDAVREALQGFINDLTGSLRNRDTMLTINHDALRRRIAQGKSALAALDSRAGDAGEVVAPLGFVLEEAEHDAECGCPEETWGTPYGSLNMHLSAGKLSNAHLDNGEGEWEIEVTFATAAEARAAFFGWAIGLHHVPATPAPAVDAVPAGEGEGGTNDLKLCPSCGALPVDWTESPFGEAAVNEAVERMRADPFGDDAHLLGTTQQDERMRHYARAALSHGEGRK